LNSAAFLGAWVDNGLMVAGLQCGGKDGFIDHLKLFQTASVIHFKLQLIKKPTSEKAN
jgi:hypothetical protein